MTQFLKQWGNPKNLVNRFDFGVEEFTTQAGETAMLEFKKSFVTHSFFGTPWKPRESIWGKKHKHPILLDTGKLQRSIFSYGYLHSNNLSRYNINTNEKSVAGKKRGRNKPPHTYAAIHNQGGYPVNQYSNKLSVKRQFIGHHKLLNERLDDLIPIIFRQFPI